MMLMMMMMPRYQLISLGRRSFAVAGPTWNSLSADLRDPTCSDESFRRSLKTFLFANAKYGTSVSSALEGFLRRCAIKIDIIYLSIYLSMMMMMMMSVVWLVQVPVPDIQVSLSMSLQCAPNTELCADTCLRPDCSTTTPAIT